MRSRAAASGVRGRSRAPRPPGRCRWRTAPSSRGCRIRRAGPRAQPACARARAAKPKRAPVQLAVQHQAAADAGADGDQHHVALARARAEAWLRPRPRRWRRSRPRPAGRCASRVLAHGSSRQARFGANSTVDRLDRRNRRRRSRPRRSSSLAEQLIDDVRDTWIVPPGLAAGVNRFSFAMMWPFSSTTPAATLYRRRQPRSSGSCPRPSSCDSCCPGEPLS